MNFMMVVTNFRNSINLSLCKQWNSLCIIHLISHWKLEKLLQKKTAEFRKSLIIFPGFDTIIVFVFFEWV